MGHNGSNATTKLKVFEADIETDRQWLEMNDLDGQALFVSKRCSLKEPKKKKSERCSNLLDCRAMIEGFSGIICILTGR